MSRSVHLFVVAGLVLGICGLAQAQTITEFTVPTAASQPQGITLGPDGNIWFVEHSGPNGKVAKMTLAGAFTEFTLPTAGSAPRGIGTGPDGNLWILETSGNRVGKMTPAGVLTEFAIPAPGNLPFFIVNGPDNNLWFTTQGGNLIFKLATDGTFTPFTPPTASNYLGITVGPDNALWFAESTGNKIGRITTAGVITEFPVLTAASGPFAITAGTDGNVWFAENGGNKIGRITPAGVVTEFGVPTAAANPSGITLGPDGALWFAENGANKIGRITMAGVVTTELIVPTAVSGPINFATGPDGNLYFTEIQASKIGKITLPTPAGPSPLLASILPTSRSVQVGNFATVFATIVNSTINPQTACRITLDPSNYVPGFFSYQTTNPATNVLSGTPNTAANISASGLQTYVIAIKAGGALPPSDIKFNFVCEGSAKAVPITGVNTLQLVFDTAPVADMIAVGVTPSNDGYSHTGGNSGTGVFAVATTNIGPATVLTAKPRLSDGSLPLTATICETNSSAVCNAPPAAQVSRSFGNNEASTFSVFITASGAVPPDPAARRVFLEFLEGTTVRGSTSTAVTTQ